MSHVSIALRLVVFQNNSHKIMENNINSNQTYSFVQTSLSSENVY